jgi:chromosome condensin MukBEF complex kleisin-like MukF subunit
VYLLRQFHALLNINHANKHADSAARIIGPHEEPAIRYLSAVKRLVKERLLTRWKQYWETSDKGRSTARLTPSAIRSIRKLYVERRKEYSALLIQLKISVIGFNSFLFRRRISLVLSRRYPYNIGTIIV